MTEAPASSARTLAACATVAFTYFATVGLYNPYAPLWFKDLGVPVFELGLLASLPNWTRLLTPLIWGTLADRSGERGRLVRAAAVMTLLAGMSFLLHPMAGWLAVAILAMHAANSGVIPVNEIIVAQHLSTSAGAMDPGRYGRVRVWGTLGFLLSVFGFGFVLEALGTAAFPWLLTSVLAMLVIAAWRLPTQREAGHDHSPHLPLWPVLRQPRVRWFFAGVLLMVMGHTGLYAFFSLYLDSLGYSKRIVGMLWAVSMAVEVVWFLLQGRWLLRSSLHFWLVLAALVASARFAATAAFGATLWVLVIVQMSHAVTFAAQHTACTGTIARYFSGSLRGRGQAMYAVLGYGVSGVLGGLLGASLSTAFGYAAVFWAGSIACLGSAVCHRHAWKLDEAVPSS